MLGSTSSYQLIDGQQRLTTLTILLQAISNVARSRGLNDFADEVAEDYLLFKDSRVASVTKSFPGSATGKCSPQW